MTSRWTLLLLILAAAWAAPAATGDFQKLRDGVELRTSDGTLRVRLVNDSVVRVNFAKSAILFSRRASAVVPYTSTLKWTLADSASELTLSTPKLIVHINRNSGRMSFANPAGRTILAEAADGRHVDSAEVQGEETYHVRQLWQLDPDESLYGLGQQQKGILDIKGYDLDLWQHNTNVVVPFLVSSRGYGILWDNMSYSRFGDLRSFVPVPAEDLLDIAGKAGGLTVEPMDGSAATVTTPDIELTPVSNGGHPKATRWQGSILAPATGDYQLRTTSNGKIKVWFDGRLVIDHFRQNWLADEDQVKLRLDAGHRYPIKLEWTPEGGNTVRLAWKTPSEESDKFSLWSEVGDGVDYYFVYGPKLDDVVAGYRSLTGQAPLMPRWAFGLWQSRQRYETAQQSLGVISEFRQRQIPFDNIVQDWQYWKPDSWGSDEFDRSRFPDPDTWIKAIHEMHAHLMISVWGKYYPGTANFDAMEKAGYFYQTMLDEKMRDWLDFPYTFYDAFNPGARQMFWSQVNRGLFQKGIDAWWMDATEPDVLPSPPELESQKAHLGKTAMGTGARVLNGYPLYNSEAVYDGQRSAAPNRRVFILTRSGFAGSQRYASAIWSGDITSTWTAMAKQIPAGLGFSISGLPYWTQDVGGYTMEPRFSARNIKPEDLDEWRELNARWFEFGVFTPLLRVHGELRPREMWTLGGETEPAYQAELKFDRLRYCMLPYIYTLAADATRHAGTIMRPLVMDFPADRTARELNDEYMFGPSFLVAPVTTYKARSRPVYLPSGAVWYDFWTGKTVNSGTHAEASAPYDAIPVYVKAGSIIPFGPVLQYIDDKPAPSDPLTLYVYGGVNASFTLYEDQGTTYDYEKGAFAEIPIEWNDANSTLTIGRRRGSFPEMLRSRKIHVVLCSHETPAGFHFESAPTRTIQYSGEAVTINLK